MTELIVGLRPTNERRRYKKKRRLSLAGRKPRISPEYDLLLLEPEYFGQNRSIL